MTLSPPVHMHVHPTPQIKWICKSSAYAKLRKETDIDSTTEVKGSAGFFARKAPWPLVSL